MQSLKASFGQFAVALGFSVEANAQRRGWASSQSKSVGQALVCRKTHRLAEQIRVKVDAGNGVGSCSAARDFAQNYSRSAADFEDRLSLSHQNGVQQSADHANIR